MFAAKNGYIVETTPKRITQGTPTEITVKSKGGYRYVVIRKAGGGLFDYFWLTFKHNLSIEKCLYSSRLHSLARILRLSQMSGTLENLAAK